jgi:hypothetical protein
MERVNKLLIKISDVVHKSTTAHFIPSLLDTFTQKPKGGASQLHQKKKRLAVCARNRGYTYIDGHREVRFESFVAWDGQHKTSWCERRGLRDCDCDESMRRGPLRGEALRLLFESSARRGERGGGGGWGWGSNPIRGLCGQKELHRGRRSPGHIESKRANEGW